MKLSAATVTVTVFNHHLKQKLIIRKKQNKTKFKKLQIFKLKTKNKTKNKLNYYIKKIKNILINNYKLFPVNIYKFLCQILKKKFINNFN